jgi:23S rRNA (uridine2552-2'-O)-methyltransferase
VVAADVALFDALPGVEILQLDVTEAGALDRILEALGGKADLVLSDMASPAMGHRATDHIRVVALVETALDITEELLAPGGAFLAKVFQGGAGQDLVTRLKKDFAKVHHVKPKASRAESPEVYVLATGFRGHS